MMVISNFYTMLYIGQLFQIYPEGVRCYDVDDIFTVSCRVVSSASLHLVNKVSCQFFVICTDRFTRYFTLI